MANVRYCHQCAKDNSRATKFCYRCQAPLWLQGPQGETPRTCRQCGLNNPSFAKFCERCSTPLVSNPSKKPEAVIPMALNNPHGIGGESCPACGRQTELVSQYVRELKTHNASQYTTVNVGGVQTVRVPGQSGSVVVNTDTSGTVKTGSTIRIPPGLLEPRAGCLSVNLNSFATFGGGCVLTIILLGIIPLVPFIGANFILDAALAVVIGLFIASRIQKALIGPFKTQLENTRARWRRSRICFRCNAAFVSDETIYTAPESLDRLVWNAPQN